MVKRVVDEYRIGATVASITDFQQITDMGVFAPPGLVIDGVIKSVGRVPEWTELLDWLQNSEPEVEEVVFQKKHGKAESID
jgi:hypothetical protein